MLNLAFYGTDRYAQIVLDLLTKSNLFSITVHKNPTSPSRPDELGLSASFPHLFPPSIINQFGGRLYNLHPSLLPQYRNVAPVPYALAMGDPITGISLFPVSVGIDNGQLVGQLKEPIKSSDTTPILLNRLFTLGAQLFLHYLNNPSDPQLTADIPVMRAKDLIFTRRLTRESGYVEWELVQKLLQGYTLKANEVTTINPLIKLRLTHHPDRTKNILVDLIRALTGYEKVWTKAITKKGELNLSLSLSPDQAVQVLIASRPRPISWDDFVRYYL